MKTIQFLTMEGCHSCAEAKAIFDEALTNYPNIKIEEIDIASEEGQALASKYSVMASPGIIIEGELFSTGGVDKDKLLSKLASM